MFNKIYLYSTFYICIQQYAFSFNFNPNYFHSTKIFVQLQPKIISFNKNNYSTSTKNNFIQQQSSRTFKISPFNKIPRPSPIENKTSLSHASNIKNLSNKQLTDEQIWNSFLLPWQEKKLSGASYSMTSVNVPEKFALNTYFTGSIKNLLLSTLKGLSHGILSYFEHRKKITVKLKET